MYNDIPIVQHEYLYKGEQLEMKKEKINCAIWSLHDSEQYILNLEDGSWQINSCCGSTTVNLHRDMFSLTINYWQLIPIQKPVWLDQRKKNANDENQNDFNFTRDFLKKYNINGKDTPSSQQKLSEKKKVLQLVYTYVKMEQHFNILEFPLRWTLPIFLLWENVQSKSSALHYFNPKFKPMFLEIHLHTIENEQDLWMSKNLHFDTETTVSYINQREATTQLPNISISQFKNEDAKMKSGDLWKDDKSIPIFSTPKYNSLVKLVQIQSQIQAWFHFEGEFVCHEKLLENQNEATIYFSTNRGHFVHEIKTNFLLIDEDSAQKNEKVFQSHPKQMFIEQLRLILLHNQSVRPVLDIQGQIDNDLSQYQANSHHLSGNFDLYKRVECDIGVFQAYQNKVVKVRFSDRTILRIHPGRTVFHVVSKRGQSFDVLIQDPQDFSEYLQKYSQFKLTGFLIFHIDFMYYTFESPKQIIQQEKKENQMKRMIEMEMSKNNTLINYLENKIPCSLNALENGMCITNQFDFNCYDNASSLSFNETQINVEEYQKNKKQSKYQNQFQDHEKKSIDYQPNNLIHQMMPKQLKKQCIISIKYYNQSYSQLTDHIIIVFNLQISQKQNFDFRIIRRILKKGLELIKSQVKNQYQNILKNLTSLTTNIVNWGEMSLRESQIKYQQASELQMIAINIDSSEDDDKKDAKRRKNINNNWYFRKLWLHVRLLLLKNWTISKQNKKITFVQMLSPLVVCMILAFQQSVVSNITDFKILDPPISFSEKLPKCNYMDTSQQQADCQTVGISIVGEKEPWIDFVIDYVAQVNDLDASKDFQIMEQSSPKEMYRYLNENQNQTLIGIIFCTSAWPIYENIITFPCTFDDIAEERKMIFYTIVYNWTLSYKNPFFQGLQASHTQDPYSLRLKQSIDNGLLEYFSNHDINFQRISQITQDLGLEGNSFKERMNISWQEYPKISTRFANGYDATTTYGAFYFFAPIMLNFLVTVNQILREKEQKLRLGLSVMGMSHTAYWISWLVHASFTTCLLTIAQIFGGRVCGFDFFIKSPFLVQFSILFFFGVSMQTIAFFIVTVCSDVTNGYTVTYAFLLLSIVMECFLTGNHIIMLLYQDDPEWFVYILRKIFTLYPAFHYSKLYGDIVLLTNRHFSVQQSRWAEGKGFTYMDLFVKRSGKFSIPKALSYQSPSPIQSFQYLLLTNLFFGILVWYFDHVISGVKF